MRYTKNPGKICRRCDEKVNRAQMIDATWCKECINDYKIDMETDREFHEGEFKKSYMAAQKRNSYY